MVSPPPDLPQDVHGGRDGVHTLAQDLHLLLPALRKAEAGLPEVVLAGRRLDGLDGLLLRFQPAGHRRVARQVDALLHRQHRRKRDVEDLPAPAGLTACRHTFAGHLDLLHARHDRPGQRVRHPDADLVPAGVGRLVPEQDQVERLAGGFLGAHHVQDGRRGGAAVPLLAARTEMQAPVDADRHRVAQLLLGLGRAERQDGAGAAVGLDQPHRLLGGALLVRAHREAQEPGVDLLRVLGEHDASTGDGHALDADQDVQG
jgi:hypothetical protein